MSAISPRQFGPLFHGGSMQGVTEISQSIGGHRYSRMPDSYGYNFATTDFETAKQYAKDAAEADWKRTGKHHSPSVYQVEPRVTYGYGGKRYRYKWGVDPNSGSTGWMDNDMTKRDALELSSYGGSEVSLRFRSPLKAREIWNEDRAVDITPSHRSFT